MTPKNDVAIIDYGMGNLFSVQAACAQAGLAAAVTADSGEIAAAAAVVLPGVGAFGEAMLRLRDQGLDEVLIRYAGGGRPILAVCLGMQLLFSESDEFGATPGLGLLAGRVERLPHTDSTGATHKVPSIGWNEVRRVAGAGASAWAVQPLAGVADAEHFYFVHSYYVRPDPNVAVLTTTRHAGLEYASSVTHENIFACQFHPERSGRAGLRIYRNLAASIRRA